MIIIKRKKGQVLLYGLIFGLISAIIVSYFIDTNKKDFGIIGESSLSLLRVAKEAEKTLFYIDQSAKYALQQAIYDLAQSGGISNLDFSEIDFADTVETSDSEIELKNECGKLKGANIWYEIKKDASNNYVELECFNEESINSNLEYLFDKNLNKYLLNHPENIPINNYYYEIKGNVEIIGIPERPLKFDIVDTKLIQNVGKSEIETTDKIMPAPVKPGQKSCLRKARSIRVNQEITGAAGLDVPQEPPKPKEKIVISEECEFHNLQGAISVGEDLIDFTNTMLCSKGEICILRKEAFELLLNAQAIAEQKDNSLLVYGSYRTPERQRNLWEGRTPERYAQRYPDERIRQKYVCNPALGVEVCPHLSGNVIDVRFYKKEWKMTEKEWKELKKIMIGAGWVKYEKEPWHFECCGTVRYAKAKKLGVNAIG